MADDDRRSVGVRVRPNSHDFIRQLRQDLASKKYTFKVDVAANTGPATRDVQVWARTQLQKIHAAVPIHANTGPATRDMADWRRRQAGIKTVIKVHADTSAAVREIEMVRAAAKDVTIRVKADTQRASAAAGRAAGGAGRARPSGVDKDFEAGLKRGVEAAHARLGEIRSEAAKGVEVKLEVDERFDYRLQQKLRAIREKVKADPVELPIEADIRNLERQLMASKIVEKSRALNLPVQYDPTDLKQMRLQLTKLRLLEEAKEINLRVKVSRGSLERVKDAMEKAGKQFGSFSLIRSLDVGPFNLGKPTGLVGTVSTLTVLAGLLPAVTSGAVAAADGIERMAAAAALAPGAIGVLAASLATLTVGTKGISDAFSTMFAMWDEGASQQAKSATRSIAAQNNYKDAVVDETRAQERVATARREALGELRNLNNELKGGVLNEAQALLDLQKARDRYAQGDFDNNTDRLQARLDIQKAELNVATTRESNLTLQQKANDAQAKGVEGSDAVRDALDGQRRAAEATTAALEALNAGGAGATTATQKFNDQLEQLSPNARDFVMSVAGMKDEMYAFRNSIQDTIFQGAGPAFADMFNDLLPVIQPGMEKIAQGLNANLLQVFDTLKSPDGQSIIERILGGTAETQQAITGMINPLIKGVGTLVAAGSEHMPQVIELFTRFAERFAIFIDKADKDGTLDKFLDKGVGALGDMVEIGLNMIQIVNDLSNAFGGNILTDIKSITDSWHEFLSSEEGQAKLKTFLQDAKDLWAEWKPVIMELPDAFGAVADAAQRVLGFMLPAVENILGFLNKFPGAIEAIATALLISKLVGSFSTLAKTIGGIVKALTGMPGLIAKIPGVIPAAGPAGFGPAGASTATGSALGVAAAAAPLVAVTGGFLLAGQALYDRASEEDKQVAGTTITTDDLASGRTGGRGTSASDRRGSAQQQDDRQNQKLLTEDGKAPPFGSQGYNFLAKAVEDGKFKEQFPFIGLSPDRHLIDTRSGQVLPGFMTGGYTDWGRSTGKIAELHGGEYVQPADTTSHYGVGAMKAVHDKRAVISFDGGGQMPMAYPGNPQIPWERRGAQVIGGGLGIYIPGLPGPILGAGGDTGMRGSQSPFWGKVPKRNPNTPWVPGWRDKRRGVASFADGGLVWDPNSGAFVQPGAAISHGISPGQGPGILNSVTGDAAQGVKSTGSTFGDAFMSGLGIPGYGGDDKNQNSDTGWGEGGPPIGLGGGEPGPNGEAPFDIRKYGIGPGPMGSGPGDWMKFAGKQLGTFGSSLISTLGSGLLGSLGISGLSANITAASPLLQHFFGENSDSKAQGEGADQTNKDVTNLLDTAANMPGNPDYPGVPGLPSPFDPATGSAVGAGRGLQTNTARGENAIRAAFPWATNIGGVRADKLKWHPSGLALDVMIPGAGGLNDPTPPDALAKGNQLYAWLTANKDALGIDYMLWQEKDHYNHIHVNFAASGYGPGGGPVTGLVPVQAGAPPAGGWGMGSAVSSGADPSKNLVGSGTASMSLPPKGDPKKLFGAGFFGGGLVPSKVMDRGGIIGPGTTMVHNYTGRPELVIPSYAAGGYSTGVMPYKPPPPRPPDAITKRPPPIQAAPKPAVPAITPPAPPIANAPHIGTGAPPGPENPPAPQGPGGGPIDTGPSRPATGVGPDGGTHTHPALATGITSGFAAAGKAASAAASMGLGGMGGGAAGGFIEGLFGQAGKIANNVANVASSFLVGNITGGTTKNPYGVTQRGNVPTGGSKVVDASNNQYGDVYTNNLDEYFKQVDRRNNQQAQADLGRWGTQV